MGFARNRFAETRHHSFDGYARGHFSFVVPTDAIGDGEKPAVRMSAGGCVGHRPPQEIFVVVSDAPGIR
jgi:hypothetical protein